MENCYRKNVKKNPIFKFFQIGVNFIITNPLLQFYDIERLLFSITIEKTEIDFTQNLRMIRSKKKTNTRLL